MLVWSLRDERIASMILRGMLRFLHTIWSALPSKLFGGAGWLGSAFISLWPEQVKEWAAWLATPEQFRFWGLMGLGLFSTYWAIWLKLRPKDPPPISSYVTHGGGSHILSGTFNAPVNIVPSDESRRAAPIELWAFSELLNFKVGETVGGIQWKKGYIHSILKIRNPTDESYSELNVIIDPELPIISANCRSDLGEPKIGLIGTPHPTTHIYENEDGTHTAYSEEPDSENITIGPPYRLYCPNLPSKAEIRVDLAVVLPIWDTMADTMWQTENLRGPAHIDVRSSYKAYGKTYHDDSRLLFNRQQDR